MSLLKRNNEELNTAVLFLVFNRPDATKQVFEAIRKAKPPRLYVAADGPRISKDGEAQLVQQVRSIATNVDWDCEVKTLFRDENLGCKYAVSGAITWFFQQEEQGIILEDDCLPSQSFFLFCEELLRRYKDDLRVWHISGNNFQNGVKRGESSYYFSKFNHIWGWASWANRWSNYDVEIKSYDSFIANNVLNDLFELDQDKKYWSNIFDLVNNGKIDTWDYQWTYTVWVNSGLSVLPNKNLVSNIGFGPTATHTKDIESYHSRLSGLDLSFPISHPIFIVKNSTADKITALKTFTKGKLISRAFNKLKKILR
ncbi:MAG: nucleotide-diphospho-sugar transferase [Bacteroidales bacterium]|nr:nucleotide-diphospho-sugar transferase [Bacteroidales bacterium]